MKKSENSLYKDFALLNGKVWVRDSSYDIRQASGVAFGGRYLTPEELYNIQWYRQAKKRNESG